MLITWIIYDGFMNLFLPPIPYLCYLCRKKESDFFVIELEAALYLFSLFDILRDAIPKLVTTMDSILVD